MNPDTLRHEMIVDRAAGWGTVARRTGLWGEDLTAALSAAGLYTSTITVEARRGVRASNGDYIIVHPHRRPISAAPTILAHLAGLAETRLLLNAPADQWTHAMPEAAHGRIPDAYWRRPGHPTAAVEYDRGTYGHRIREEKMFATLRLNRSLIWTGPNPARLRRVQQQAAALTARWNRDMTRAANRSGAPVHPTDLRRMQLTVRPVFWDVGSDMRTVAVSGEVV